ncbi:MAG: IS1 family transposase [Thaumarchaeota archaeon]|nr:IS1 family transposase [Nitrososphaerota archaeon]
MALPTLTHKLEVYTDGNKQYITALLNNFRKDCLIYGQLIKIKRNKRFVFKFKRKIFGNPSYNDIDTVNIESYNGVLRERVSCLVRRTKCFSKQRSTLEKHLDIFQAYNNTMKQDNDDQTPCEKEGLTSKKWEWMNFFTFR